MKEVLFEKSPANCFWNKRPSFFDLIATNSSWLICLFLNDAKQGLILSCVYPINITNFKTWKKILRRRLAEKYSVFVYNIFKESYHISAGKEYCPYCIAVLESMGFSCHHRPLYFINNIRCPWRPMSISCYEVTDWLEIGIIVPACVSSKLIKDPQIIGLMMSRRKY